MYNWNTPKKNITRSKQSTIWKLNQLINFGLNGEKLNLRLVRIYWDKLTIDPKRQSFLKFLLWNKLS